MAPVLTPAGKPPFGRQPVFLFLCLWKGEREQQEWGHWGWGDLYLELQQEAPKAAPGIPSPSYSSCIQDLLSIETLTIHSSRLCGPSDMLVDFGSPYSQQPVHQTNFVDGSLQTLKENRSKTRLTSVPMFNTFLDPER